MDFDKLQAFIIEHASDYLHAFAATLRSPILKFPPLQESKTAVQESKTAVPQNRLLLVNWKEPVVSQRLNPHLLGFAIICIFIGSTLHAIVPGKKTAPGFVTIAVLVTLSWLVCSCLIYVICLPLKGSGSFIETVSICLQLFAVIYVVSSFAALIGGILIAANSPNAMPLEYVSQGATTAVPLGVTATKTVPVSMPAPFSSHLPFINIKAFFQHPFLLYFLFQTLLLIIYLPFGIKKIQRFRGYKAMLAMAALPVSIMPLMFINISTYEVVGTPLNGYVPPEPTPIPQLIQLIGIWHPISPPSSVILVFKESGRFVMGHLDDKYPDLVGVFERVSGGVLLRGALNPRLYKPGSKKNSYESQDEKWYDFRFKYHYKLDNESLCYDEGRDYPYYIYREPGGTFILLPRCWTRASSTEQDTGLPKWAVSQQE